MSNLNGTIGGLTDVEISELDGLFDVVIASPTSGQVLTYDAANNRWINASAAGGGLPGSGTVTSVSAGGGLSASVNPITESGDLFIADTGVSAGTYTLTTLTVNARGQITAASNGVGGAGTVTSAGVTGANGIVVAGSPITTQGVIGLSLLDITPRNVTASGAVTGSNLSGTNTGDQTITLSGDVTGTGTGGIATTLANTTVSAGSYTLASITVDAKGRITAASNGAAGTGTVTSVAVSGKNGIVVAGSPITESGVIDLGLGAITPSSVSTGTVSATAINVTGDIQAATGRVFASAATLTGKLTAATAVFTGLISADAGINITGDLQVAAGRVTCSAATVAGAVSAASVNVTGDIQAATGRVTASAATISGALTAASARFTGVVSADAGLRTTTLNASGVITGQNLSGTNTGDQTITLTGDVSGSGTGTFATTINPGVVSNAKLASMGARTLKSNVLSSAATPADNSISAVLDAEVSGGVWGDLLYRGDGTWRRLPAGNNGHVLSTGGVSANPSWIAVGGTGTVTSVSAGSGLVASPNPITGTGAIQLDVSAENAWLKQQYYPIATLTDASAVAWDVATQPVAQLTIAGAGRVLQNPTGMRSGATYMLHVISGTTSAGLSYDTAYKWPSSAAPTIGPVSGAVSILTFACRASAMFGVAQTNFG